MSTTTFLNTAAPAHSTQGVLLPNELLAQVRERFLHVDTCPYSGKRTYFENAGGSLTLKSVVTQGADIAAIPDNEHRDNPASHAISAIVAAGRNDLTTFFGTSPDNGVIFGGETGTECLFRLIRAAALSAEAGGSFVACSIEHPATYDATRQWAQRTTVIGLRSFRYRCRTRDGRTLCQVCTCRYPHRHHPAYQSSDRNEHGYRGDSPKHPPDCS